MQRYRFGLLLGTALVIGAALGWMDSRPGWDDTGITVGVLLLATATWGLVWPGRAWLWALAIGAWIPLFGIALQGSGESVAALGLALAGAYLGALARWAITAVAQ